MALHRPHSAKRNYSAPAAAPADPPAQMCNLHAAISMGVLTSRNMQELHRREDPSNPFEHMNVLFETCVRYFVPAWQPNFPPWSVVELSLFCTARHVGALAQLHYDGGKS